MQVKKYIAPSLKEASAKMKLELGSDAIILSTRVIEEDTGFGKKKLFEILSGIEEEGAAAELHTRSFDINTPRSTGNTFEAELKKITDKVFVNTDNYISKTKRIVHKKNALDKPSGLEKELKEVVAALLHREVKKPIILNILNYLKKNKNILRNGNLDKYVISSIASIIPTVPFEVKKKSSPKIIAFVGPTGVGKTTCIAKLAVLSKILHNLDVGLISIDTFRLGAIDQLRIFSEISDTDMKVAYEPSEMKELVKGFKHKNVIFIDTAGRSQKNVGNLKETFNFLDEIEVDETALVLSSTNSTRNLIDAAEKFSVFNYNSLILSKIDEAITFGNILNLVTHINKPIMFLTNGQVIPDDIISADADFLANMIFTGKISA